MQAGNGRKGVPVCLLVLFKCSAKPLRQPVGLRVGLVEGAAGLVERQLELLQGGS